MEYLKEGDNIQPLGRHNVDFGGGLERLAALLQNVDSVYEIDIYKPILSKVQALRKQENLKSERIIVDHIKAATWIIMDGVLPGRSQQGYILRRLIRRAVRHARKLEIEQEFTREVADICITQFRDIWDKLEEKREYILNTIEEEERKFNRTLEQGLRELEKRINKKEKINGRDAFILYETYGLPLEVTEEILEEKGKHT